MLFGLTIQLRIVHTSDSHGWLYGNPHEQDSANFGDILSFIAAQKEQKPTIALDSGDFISGSGLSDATDIQGQYVYEAWAQSFQYNEFYDYVTFGNHDVSDQKSIKVLLNALYDENVHNHTISYNIFANGGALTNRFKFTTIQNTKFLVLGFMYNMKTPKPLQIKSFIDEIKKDQLFSTLVKNAEAFLILLHAGMQSDHQNYQLLYQAIRSLSPNPIIILGGHEHLKGFMYPVIPYSSFDNIFPQTFNESGDYNAIFVESENYLRSITLLDFEIVNNQLSNVQYKTLQSNKQDLLTEVNLDQFSNLNAIQIQNLINEHLQQLQLLRIIGNCDRNFFYQDMNPNSPDSIYNLWLNQVVKVLFDLNESQKLIYNPISLIGTAFFNSNIYKGPVYKNDLYATAPYKNEFFYLVQIQGQDLRSITNQMNANGLKYVVSDINFELQYSLIINDYDYLQFKKDADKLKINVQKESYTKYSTFDLFQLFVTQNWGI
ncbi:5'_nucleotidase family protein [Hexamita inflata]|uniref:5' nucleotidase family protein n=1 Tax=Hexamita inflata TaxID=28002 RepID=A0AA86UME4_9EUKA|nr:5' nucleotidase family protein [Hexamita inflata]